MVEVSPSSDWCQRWRNGQHTWRHRSDGGFDADRYTVELIPPAEAKAYVLEHHYSGSFPSAKFSFGMFDAGRIVGVLVLGSPTSNAVLTNVFPTLAAHYESIELSRLVLADAVAANGESWFIARCFEEAAVRGVRGVVSFADPVPRVVAGVTLFPGHLGLIYQASNAVFAGRGTPRSLVVLRNGQVLNARAMQKVRQQERGHDYVEQLLISMGARTIRAGEPPAAWLAAAISDAGAVRLRHPGNYRYCFRIGSRAQRRAVRIALGALPYPKTLEVA